MFHPLFSLALHRASVIALHKGTITEEQANTIDSIITNPNRKSLTGEHADVLDLTRQKTAELARGDSALPPEVHAEVGMTSFNWQAIWTWIENHLPQILQCIAAIISIFVKTSKVPSLQ